MPQQLPDNAASAMQEMSGLRPIMPYEKLDITLKLFHSDSYATSLPTALMQHVCI